MSLLLESVIKSSLVILIALCIVPWLRGHSAALRHWLLSAALVCAAAAPLAQNVVPAWYLPVELFSESGESIASNVVARQSPLAGNAKAQAANSVASIAHDAAPTTWPLPLGNVLLAIWIAGAVFGITVIVVGLLRLARLTSRSRPMTTGLWVDRARDIAAEYGFRRPVQLLQGTDPMLLVTWGLLRPRVIVPPAARSWPESRVRLVLYHELAHVRRADWIVQLAAELVRAIYWFNPLVWIICARLRQESEQACDDEVLRRGVAGSDYASHLVEIARDLRQQRMWIPAPAIARSSSLERRVRAMLDTRLNRRPLSRVAGVVALLLVTAITIPIAGLAAQAFGSLTGAIVDPTNGVLPGVTLVLTNQQTKAKYEVQTDRNGRYEFVGLPPGDYSFETKLAGFSAFRGTVAITGVSLQQNVTLQVGELTERVTVVGGPRDAEPTAPPDPDKARELEERLKKRATQRCPGGVKDDGTTRIGGNIRAPMKIRHVGPRYPANLQGVEGDVSLRATIGTDGLIQDVTVVSSAHPDLTQSATEAVSQWQFDPTLLNCSAIPVHINVTVQFRYQQ